MLGQREGARVGATTQHFGATLALAGDPHLTDAQMLSLAVHREPSVRAAVARRADCPASALVSLGHDYRPEVLLALIGNPRTPSSVVRNLADHEAQLVATAAEERLRGIVR